MMDTLCLPVQERRWVKDSYYQAYFLSVKNSAIYAKIHVEFDTNDKVWCCPKNAYSATLNNKQFIMDFSDLKPLQLNPNLYRCPYFKWHYSYDREQHSQHISVHPLCIVQDLDWRSFSIMRELVEYTANGSLITNNQRIRGAAVGRRNRVRAILNGKYKGNVSFDFMDRVHWWKQHNNCLVAVHVPGARNDMLDRGQWELMGLGVCVISPVITTVLAGHVSLEPFKHHVPVEDDYTNLAEMIEWCREHREDAVEIGQNAKQLFNSVGPPEVFWEHVRSVLL